MHWLFLIIRHLLSIQSYFKPDINKIPSSKRYSSAVIWCVIGNTAETWSCCSSRSDCDMMRVWFSCSPFVPSEQGVKVTVPPEVCTKDKQHALARFLVCEGMKEAEIHRQLAAKYGQNCLPQWSVYEWIEMLLIRTDKVPQPHLQTNKAWSMLKQRFLETRETIAEIAARPGINVARPWCKPLV
jgi:hypothetical protein